MIIVGLIYKLHHNSQKTVEIPTLNKEKEIIQTNHIGKIPQPTISGKGSENNTTTENTSSEINNNNNNKGPFDSEAYSLEKLSKYLSNQYNTLNGLYNHYVKSSLSKNEISVREYFNRGTEFFT